MFYYVLQWINFYRKSSSRMLYKSLAKKMIIYFGLFQWDWLCNFYLYNHNVKNKGVCRMFVCFIFGHVILKSDGFKYP